MLNEAILLLLLLLLPYCFAVVWLYYSLLCGVIDHQIICILDTAAYTTADSAVSYLNYARIA